MIQNKFEGKEWFTMKTISPGVDAELLLYSPLIERFDSYSNKQDISDKNLNYVELYQNDQFHHHHRSFLKNIVH